MMINILRLSGVVLISALLAGCAGVKVYNKADLNKTSETGVRFYTAKPYLLVARTGAKEKPTDVSIVYLPDLKNPQYAQVSTGIGSAKVSIKVSNGSLSEFGGEGDAKAADLLNALTGGFKAVREGLATQRGEAIEEEVAEKQASRIQLDAARRLIDDVIRLLPREIANLSNVAYRNTLGPVRANVITSLTAATRTLGQNEDVANLELPGVTIILESVSKTMGASATEGGLQLDDVNAVDVQTYRTALALLKVKIDSALRGLKPKEKKPTFELYEILMNGSATELRQIEIP